MATTYSELQEEIATWMVRDDLGDVIPTFIAMAENRLTRMLRVPEMEDVVTATVSAQTVTLPTDFLELKSAKLDTDPETVLEQMGLDELRRNFTESATDKPRYFALQSGNEMVFGPPPDDEYVVILNYYKKLPALSDDNTSNWLLEGHPDIYLATCMVEAMMYTRDVEGRAAWLDTAKERIAELEYQGTRKASSLAPQRLSHNAAPWSGVTFENL